MLDVINQLTAEMRNKVRLMVGRCILSAIKDSGRIQTVQARLLDGETHDDVERVQQYGFSSVPEAGAEGVVIFAGGNRDHGLVIATDDRRYRPVNLQDGDVCIYRKGGAMVIMRLNETEIIDPIKIKLTAPIVAVSSKLTVGDNIVAINDVVGSGKSLATHTHGGVQPGGGNTGAPN